MRLVIDLQGAQGPNRTRGIGLYCLALARELARRRGAHEVIVALNGDLEGSVEPVRAAFGDLLPAKNFVVWRLRSPINRTNWFNRPARHAAEHARESILASLHPDFVLVSSVFEGFGSSCVTSIGRTNARLPTAAVFYDVIPLIYPDEYLAGPVLRRLYREKLEHLERADLLLTISDAARREALEHLAIDASRVVNISSAADDRFTPAPVDPDTRARLGQRYGLRRPFVMYTGGIEFRKNVERLIEAYAAVPAALREAHQLAVVCAVRESEREGLVALAMAAGLAPDEVVLTGFVPHDDLLACYRACKAFVFPSLHEGFGLPVLEAMMCGRAVIAANRTSLPEVVGCERALFDPYDVGEIAAKLVEVLTDDEFRAALERHGLARAGTFRWDDIARRAWSALEASHARRTSG